MVDTETIKKRLDAFLADIYPYITGLDSEEIAEIYLKHFKDIINEGKD